MTPPRLLVIQHDLDDALNELAAPLVEAGLFIETWCTWRSEQPQWPLDSFDGVLSLGGLASVRDEHSIPWISNEIALLQAALASGIPILGVCFGAQILARAAGGRVRRSPVTEIGWYEVDMSPAGTEDAVLGSLGPRPLVFQAHYDTIDLPAGAVALGTTGDLVQAFRLGRNAWGVQFHIEANPSVVYSWLAVYRDAFLEAGVDIGRLRLDTGTCWRGYRQGSWQVGAAFAAQVAGVEN